VNVAHGPAAGQWLAVHPREAPALLGHVPARWWIAGGWALDLFVGRQRRPHKDLDIGILRRDLQPTLAALSGWELFEARGGELFGPVTSAVRAGISSLWARRAGAHEWVFELMLDDCEAEQWVFRRDRRIRRALDTVVRHDREGLPYLAPEVQLLYKASHTRREDDLDFEDVSAHLDEAARRWLSAALSQLDPQHRWVRALG